MILQSALFTQLALQTTTSNSQWWWLFIVGLILLVAFFYWWQQVSEKDLATLVAFEKQHPQGLAMPPGFSLPAAASDAPDDHDHGVHGHGVHGHDAHDAHGETAVFTPADPDDLKRIEGIGPKIADLLNQAGIFTYAQLAAAAVADLNQILEKAGPRYELADPASWPQQAKLAAVGDWTALDALQETLKGGRQAK